jgi:hypothetical protein
VHRQNLADAQPTPAESAMLRELLRILLPNPPQHERDAIFLGLLGHDDVHIGEQVGRTSFWVGQLRQKHSARLRALLHEEN